MIADPRRWRAVRGRARPAALVSAALRALTLGTVGTAGPSPAGAAAGDGAASIVEPGGGDRPLRRGGSATPFNLDLGPNPACPGDSASGNLRLQSFMIPASADLGALTFGTNGPVAVGGQFRQPLFDVNSSPYVSKLTDIAVPPATTGGISGLPAFDFAVFSPGDIPAGDYPIGIACTLGPAGPSQLKTFWSVTVTVSAAAADRPAGITWRAANAPPRPPPANPDGETTRTTSADGRTTTTADPGGSTTTTADPAGSTSTIAGASFAGSDPSEPSVSATVGRLPLTGSSPWYRVVWGLGLLVLGRVVFLLARRPKVRPIAGG